MKYFKCENCGSDLVKNPDNTCSCSYCKRTYYDDSLEKAYKRVCENLHNTMQGILTDELLKQKIEQIANCRQALYKARTGQFIDSKQVEKWSEEILKLVPDDALLNSRRDNFTKQQKHAFYCVFLFAKSARRALKE